MSEIRPWPMIANAISTSNGRAGDWKSLRLSVSRDRGLLLTVALVTTPWDGHPRLDANIRGCQVAWDPRLSQGDGRLYALQQALLGVAQTRR